jgi:hypothetical protein
MQARALWKRVSFCLASVRYATEEQDEVAVTAPQSTYSR